MYKPERTIVAATLNGKATRLKLTEEACIIYIVGFLRRIASVAAYGNPCVQLIGIEPETGLEHPWHVSIQGATR